MVVVDESPVVRAGMRTFLAASDIRVVGEASPGDAARVVRVRAPHVVLVHVRVGQPNGLELVTRLKAAAPKASVLVLSRSESPGFAARALALGCSGYLHESASGGQLRRAVHAVARGECIIDPRLLREVMLRVHREPAPRTTGAPEALSTRQREILRLITEGRTNRQIADTLGSKVATVKGQVQKIIQALEVSDRTQAAVKAITLGLLA